MDQAAAVDIVRARARGARHSLAARVVGALALAEDRRLARAHTGAVCSVAVGGAQGRWLLSAGADASVQLFDLDSSGGGGDRDGDGGAGVRLVGAARSVPARGGHARIVSSVAWYPVDGGLFTTGALDGTVRVWDAATLEEACRFDAGARVRDQALSPTGAHALVAAAAESPYVRLGDLRTGAFAQSLPAQQAGGTAVAWSPRDPYALASAGVDGSVRLWDVRRAAPHLADLGGAGPAHAGGACGLLFAPGGQRVVSVGADHVIRVWDLAAPQSPTAEFPGAASTAAAGNRLAYAPVGKCELALAGGDILFCPRGDAAVAVVDLAGGRQLAPLDGHLAPALCAAWRPARQELYTGGADSNVIAWCAPPHAAPSAGQARLRADAWSDSEPEPEQQQQQQ
ncbi:hypothetical protein H4R18_003533 [Coemansia javaensis]|uniref:Uncharacterized protein n=1 Tax=Coemansia javaensis TaxID=2761396 RepID=A0A9W8H8U1_9FUNG|nr:hypothetical protein H4R18_003533 [Coemansia javaensis]